MKIRFERDNKGMKVFTKQEYLDAAQNHEKNVRPGLKGTDLYALSYMQFLFRTTKEFFKDDRLLRRSLIMIFLLQRLMMLESQRLVLHPKEISYRS